MAGRQNAFDRRQWRAGSIALRAADDEGGGAGDRPAGLPLFAGYKAVPWLIRQVAVAPAPGRAEALRQSMIALMDSPGFVGPDGKQVLFSYAHPIFWAPFSLVGDGGG
jgi:hypothetical protein